MRRLISYFIAFIVTPVALIALLEGGLRVTGYGHSTQAFVAKQVKGKTVYFRNRYFLYSALNAIPGLDSWNTAEFGIEVEKPANTRRIFIFGSSAAQGDPIYGFTRSLEILLRSKFPDTRFEVYNCAFAGLNSNVMALMAEACAKFHPDFYVIYMGNNELCGPFGLYTSFRSFSPRQVRWAVRGSAWLSNLRLFQCFQHEPPPYSGPPVSPDDPLVEKTYQVFAANLRDMCTAAVGAGARTVVATVGTDLRDWRPDSEGDGAPLHAHPLSAEALTQWDRFRQRGGDAEKAGDYRGAINLYLQAAALDVSNADLSYALGRCYWNLGDFGNARKWFTSALEWDGIGTTRTRPRLNEVIKATVASFADTVLPSPSRGPGPPAVILADVANDLDVSSPGGIAGWECFHDHCHFTFHGGYVLACSIFKAVAQAMTAAETDLTPLSEELCADRLGWTAASAWGSHQTHLEERHASGLGMPRDGYAEYVAGLKARAAAEPPELALEAVRAAAEKNPLCGVVCDRSIATMVWDADIRRVEIGLSLARQFVEQFPYLRDGRRLLGEILARLNRADEAKAMFTEQIHLFPDDYATYISWAKILKESGRTGEAVHVLEQGQKADPRNEMLSCESARFLLEAGDTAGAIRAGIEAVRRNPESRNGYSTLDGIYLKTGAGGARVAVFKKMARRFPREPFAQAYLGYAQESAGDLGAAEESFRTAVKISSAFLPTILDHLEKSGKDLGKAGKAKEARARLEVAMKLDPQNNRIRAELAELTHP